MNPAMNMMPMMNNMMPMDGADREMFMECCKRMMAMMSGGMPMMTCGGMMMCCMMAA